MLSLIRSKIRGTLNGLVIASHWGLEALYAPFRWITHIARMTAHGVLWWWRSRQFRSLLWGMPALAIVVTCTGFVMVAKSVTSTEVIHSYVVAARYAADKSDWHKSKLYFERALELGMRDSEALFELATVAENAGDTSRMAAVLDYLAPDDQAVYAEAHLWKATQILARGEIDQKDFKTAERQLQLALQLDSRLAMGHALLGDLYFQTGVMGLAIEHLSQSHKSSVMYRLKLARALTLTGDPLKAKLEANQILSYAEEACRKDPRDIQARLNWSEAALFTDDEQRAITILSEGIRLADHPDLRQALTMVWIRQSDDLLKISGKKSDAFQILAAALENTPTEILLFDRLLQLLTTTAAGETVAQDVESFLNENIILGRAVGISHLILGTYLFERNQPDKAGLHLNQAFQLLPQGPVVANNFAWYLAKSEPSNPEKALKIVEVLLISYPANLEFRDTRGHIFMSLEKWQEAVADFESTLSVFGDRASTHETLAIAYEKLGLFDIASGHRKVAKGLREKIEDGPQRSNR